jgi:hypothetical protein
VQLPFTREEFFEVFARYNVDVWPLQWGLVAAGLIAAGVLFRRSAHKERVCLALLSLLWAWMGAVYHLQYFASINPAAVGFGVLTLAEGGLLAWAAAKSELRFAWRGVGRWVGLALVAYGLAVYPLLNVALGHEFPAVPTFGLPSPTTIFTLGLLWWLRGGHVRILVVIPLLWCAVGGSAAFALGVPQALGLLIAGVVSLVLLKRIRR